MLRPRQPNWDPTAEQRLTFGAAFETIVGDGGRMVAERARKHMGRSGLRPEVIVQAHAPCTGTAHTPSPPPGVLHLLHLPTFPTYYTSRTPHPAPSLAPSRDPLHTSSCTTACTASCTASCTVLLHAHAAGARTGLARWRPAL